MADFQIPALVKHTVLAIYKEGGLHYPWRERFRRAMDIARSRLVEYGYLREGSQEGPVENIVLTAKGMRQDFQHRHEHDGHRKNRTFDRYYEHIEIAYREDTAKTPGQAEQVKDRQERREQAEVDRLAKRMR